MSRRARQRQAARPWLDTIEPDEDYSDDDEEPCELCHGDGRDPYTDYLLPCPHCQGSDLAADRAKREQQPAKPIPSASTS